MFVDISFFQSHSIAKSPSVSPTLLHFSPFFDLRNSLQLSPVCFLTNALSECRGTSTYSEHHMWYIPPRDIAWNARIQLLYPKWLISSLAVGLHKQRHTLKAAPGCLTMSTGWMIPAGAAKTHPLWFSLHGLRRYIIRTCNFQRILYILTPVPNTLSPLIWFIIHIYLSNEWMDCEFFLACLLLPETEDRRMRNGPKSQSKMIKRQHCQLCTYRVFESVHSTYIYC